MKRIINRETERRNVEMIKQIGLLMGLQNTLKKINEHGKGKKSTRTRKRSS